MITKTYILCPGQGAQAVGMGKDFYEASQAARKLFDLANQVVGFDLCALTFNGPEHHLNQTNISQPAIYVTSIACFQAAKEAGVVDPEQVTVYAGLSLGEYTALHLAGVVGFEDGLRLVASRGKHMQDAAAATPSGMVAIMGADEATIDDLCAKSAEGEVLVPANFNAPGQIVVSGSKGACERVQKAAESAGFKSVSLAVAGAFHSPIMQSGAEKMVAELEKVVFEKSRFPVYSNVTAQPHSDPQSIKRLLVEQIIKPVRWEQTMQSLAAKGDARWIELAPDRKLTGMLKKINRRLPVESFATIDALKKRH